MLTLAFRFATRAATFRMAKQLQRKIESTMTESLQKIQIANTHALDVLI